MELPKLPTVTRRLLPSGKFRYFQDGEIHTARSNRDYSYASAYYVIRRVADEKGQETKQASVYVYLHSRYDLAAKGNQDANDVVQAGYWRRIHGVIEIRTEHQG